jgi:hypothetical protein
VSSSSGSSARIDASVNAGAPSDRRASAASSTIGLNALPGCRRACATWSNWFSDQWLPPT